jgi:hypothetical protein
VRLTAPLVSGLLAVPAWLGGCGGPVGDTTGSATAALGGASNSVGTEGDAAPFDWTKIETKEAPPPRGYLMMSYLAQAKQVVVFGGQNENGMLEDTWLSIDGVTWRNVTGQVSPPARAAGCMAYDAPSRELVLYGGTDGKSYLGDTWTLDEDTLVWREESPLHSPAKEIGCSAFTDPSDGHADVYGGYIGEFYELSTYRWTGHDWSLLPIGDNHAATARDFAMSGSDEGNHTVVIFGGLGDVNPDNTWSFDGTDYTNLTPRVQPPLRYGALGAFEPGLNGLVIFGGGIEGTGDYDDTWLWKNRKWTEPRPGTSPSKREGYGLIYDSNLGHVILFGGQLGLEGPHGFRNDVWESTP